MNTPPLFLGVDFGTSGCRAVAIDNNGEIHGQSFVTFPAPEQVGTAIEQSPTLWWQGLQTLLQQLSQHIPLSLIVGLAIDGTSGTIIATDDKGHPLHTALMYNDARAYKQAALITQCAPINSAAHGATSGLAKMLWLLEHLQDQQISHFTNQSDWIVGQLSGEYSLSDYNNCLKMGYDAINHCWPIWLDELPLARKTLPKAHAPGSQLTVISKDAAKLTGLTTGTVIYAGTTDSTAAIYASGANQPGDAITSLGSTLVTKVISKEPIFSPSSGVYSQPFAEHWLVGGGSNSGGNVLLHYFTPEQMKTLSRQIDPDIPSGLNYYPLLSPGERFPVCNPKLSPRLDPRPNNDGQFFHGLLEGIANIEHQAYTLLSSLGAPYPSRIYSAGGGSNNKVWEQIRANILNIQMLIPEHQDAAYGVALLAKNGHHNRK